MQKAKSRRNRRVTESERRFQEAVIRLERLAYIEETVFFAKKEDELRRDLGARTLLFMETVGSLKLNMEQKGSKNQLVEAIDKLMEDMKEVERHFTAKIEESKLLPEKAGTDINTRIKEANHLKDEIDGYFAEAFRAVKYLELEHEKLLFEETSSRMRQIVEENTTKLAAKVTAIRVQAERVKAAKSTIEDLNDTIDFIIDSGDQLIVQADNLKYLPEKRGGDKEFKVAELNRFLEEEKKFYSQANDSIERSLNEIQPSLKARERHVKILLIQLLSVPIISTLFIYGDLGLRQELKSFESLKFTSWILTGVVSVTLFSIFFVLFLVLDLNLFVRTKGLQSEFLKWNIFSAAFAIIVLILTLICDRLLPNLIYPLMFSLISSVTQINPINPAFVILTNIAAILGIALPCISALIWLYKISKKQMEKI